MEVQENLASIVRIIILYALLSQLYFMIIKGTKRIVASSFYLWGFASFIMAYLYYKNAILLKSYEYEPQ